MPRIERKEGDTRLPAAWFNLNHHPLQYKLTRTTCKFPVVVAGRGSGKTECARRYIVRMLPVAKPWPDPKYFYGLPTYNQAKRVVWPQLEALIPKHWLIKNGANRSELSFTTKYGSVLYIVGMDKPARIEGIQVDGGILDECSDQKPGTFTRTILPMLTHRDGFCWQIGVPKRTGPGAMFFKECFDKGVQGLEGYESYTWDSKSVLTEDQLRQAMAKLSDKDAQEQLGGIWVDISGAVYHAYSEAQNVSEAAVYRPDIPIGVGSDFNVSPMAWVLFHYVNGRMHVFDEIWEKDTNTRATLNQLAERYPNHKAGWHFFGDASSKNRHSSSDISDYIQILNDNRFFNKKVHYPDSNPPIGDRFSAVNALLCNAIGEVRVLIHPKCVQLRKDLQQRTYKEGTKETDDTNKEAGHITDAFGYPIYRLAPVRIASNYGGKVHIGSLSL